MVNKNDITFIEICSGCGGLSKGLILAGLKPLLLNEIDKHCCETLKENHPTINILNSCFTKNSFENYIDKVDVLAGGVPCQSFSQAGNRKGFNDIRGNLILEFSKLINILKPKLFLIENVKGLSTHDKGETLKQIINHININNLYDIQHKVLNANDYGVAQKRERLFIIGTLKSLDLKYKFPKKDTTALKLKDVLIDVPMSNTPNYNNEKHRLYQMIPQGGCWINLPIEEQKTYLGNSYFSGGGKRGILYRLSMEKPSLTLLCTPSQKQTERCHPLETRPLTVKEYARIQSFPDDYIFKGGVGSQYKQIGNAVPVNLAKKIGISIYDLFTSL